MPKSLKILLLLLLGYIKLFAQEFETLPKEFISGPRPLYFNKILCTGKGTVLVANSFGILEIDGISMTLPISGGEITDNKGNVQSTGKNSNFFKDMTRSKSGIKLLCEGPGGVIYMVNENNNFACMAYNKIGTGAIMPPFDFYASTDTLKKNITAIWVSNDSDLYVTANTDTIYFIAGAAKLFNERSQQKNTLSLNYMPGLDKDSNLVVIQGAKTIKKFTLGKGIIPYAFAVSPDDNRITLIGTNNGLFGYDKRTGQSINYFSNQKDKITITAIDNEGKSPFIWFSTLEKGMGRFNILSETTSFFEYPKRKADVNTKYPVISFSRKSPNEFFVAVADSLPAVFNTETGNYRFINDTIFRNTANTTTDIRRDAFNHLLIIKGGGFYWSKTFLKDNAGMFIIDSALSGPYITDIIINNEDYRKLKNSPDRYDLLKEINLKYNENKISVFYSCRGINSDSLIFSYKINNYDNNWTTIPYSLFGDKINMVTSSDLRPGTYILYIRARNGTQPWLKNEVQLAIIISPPFWQTWWFWSSVIVSLVLLVWLIVKWRVSVVRRQERINAMHEKDLLELEAQSLRSQMNPHFIFNCMNSIKSLIQMNERNKVIDYLTAFSKLIRIVFQNSDKREIRLYDEIETCSLYMQLESMRFSDKFSYRININEPLDLKSVMVPPLIIQPFIENAIWHGIMPKEEGGSVSVTISKSESKIFCIIDDDGIGRKVAAQNKSGETHSIHQSKGVNLTQTRLELSNVLNQRNASVEIIDKTNCNGEPAGTKVILVFNEE